MICSVKLEKSALWAAATVSRRLKAEEPLNGRLDHKSPGPLLSASICGFMERDRNVLHQSAKRKDHRAGNIFNRALYCTDVTGFLGQIYRIAVEILHLNTLRERKDIGDV